MATYPWVNFKLSSSKNVSSEPILIFGSELTCIIDTIIVVNTGAANLLLDITILREVDLEPISYYFVRKFPVAAYGKQEIVNANLQTNVGTVSTPTLIYLQPGDTLFANSDFVGNRFDCHVSYRELTNSITP